MFILCFREMKLEADDKTLNNVRNVALHYPNSKTKWRYDCGLFLNTFATELLNATSPPVGACFDIPKMKMHLVYCLKAKH